MSGMLYALSIEPLLNRIRPGTSGLTLPGFNTAHILSAYADDVLILVTNQLGKTVNWEKSEALVVGRWSGGLPILPGV